MSAPPIRRLRVEALARARDRLDRLALYPRPVGTRGVRIVVVPWFFRLPRLRRYDGYAMPRTIVLRHPPEDEDLVCHELCHIWQMQHHPIRLFVTLLTTRYEANPFEAEARWAVSRTAPRP
jgi:hypothetical protein